MLRIIGLGILIMIGLVVLWHLFFPILGGVIAISAMLWMVILGSIIAFSIFILLVFILTTISVFVLPIIGLIGFIFLCALFPILFPLLLPLLIILWIVAILRKRRLIRKENKNELM